MLSPQVGVRVSGFSLSCRRRSMCRSGGRALGKYLLPREGAGIFSPLKGLSGTPQ